MSEIEDFNKKISDKDIRKCNRCGEPIVFMKTVKEKMIPCDPEKVGLISERGYYNEGRISHFNTCTGSKNQ